MSALVWMRPVSCSEDPSPSSLAVIDWLRAVTVPPAALGVPPVPPALPTPTTFSPTATLDELSMAAVCRPDALWSCRTATSLRAVVADDAGRVGLAVAHVGDADGGGAVDHVVVGQYLA